MPLAASTSRYPQLSRFPSICWQPLNPNKSERRRGTNAPKDKLRGECQRPVPFNPHSPGSPHPRVPTVPARTHQRSGCPIPPALGSAEPLCWALKCHLHGSSLKAPNPRPPRGGLATPPARGLRVPGARRLPAGGTTSRASPRTSRDTSAGRPAPQALARTTPGAPHAAAGAPWSSAVRDWGAAAGSARSPAPPGLGGTPRPGMCPGSLREGGELGRRR